MSTLDIYIYYIYCIQGNSKVGDYIIQVCYVASMYVGSIALVHRRLMAITIYLDYLHQVIILYIYRLGLGDQGKLFVRFYG